MTTISFANVTAQWYGNKYPGVLMPRLDKAVLHSTETGGWPSYGGGASRPTVTYNPALRQTRQHGHNERSARALRDPSGTAVRENQDNVAQIEIVAYSDRALARSRGHLWIGDLKEIHYEDIARILNEWHREHGLPLTSSVEWPEGSVKSVSGIRMSGSQYDAYKGILGHAHVSGNTHWDVGGFYWSKLYAAIRRLLGNTPVPPQPEPPVIPEEEMTVIVSEYGSSQFVRIDMEWPYVEVLSEGTFSSQKKMPGVTYKLLTNAQINQQISLQGYRERRMRAVMWTETFITRDGKQISALQELANIRTEVKQILERQDVEPWTYKGTDEERDAYAYLRGLDRKMDELIAAIPDAAVPQLDSADIQIRRLTPEEIEAAATVGIPLEHPAAETVMPPGLTYEPDEDEPEDEDHEA